MKFTKTSSTIAQNDVSLNFDISQISNILKETSLYDWNLFQKCNTELVLDRIFNYRIPISFFEYSKKTLYVILKTVNLIIIYAYRVS
jgi:hypothetical protein